MMKPWSKPFSLFRQSKRQQKISSDFYFQKLIYAYSPPALLHRDSFNSIDLRARYIISWKWVQGKHFTCHEKYAEPETTKKCRQKVNWVRTCATVSKRAKQTSNRWAHAMFMYTHSSLVAVVMILMMNVQKMPIKFVVSAKIKISRCVYYVIYFSARTHTHSEWYNTLEQRWDLFVLAPSFLRPFWYNVRNTFKPFMFSLCVYFTFFHVLNTLSFPFSRRFKFLIVIMALHFFRLIFERI